MALYMRSVDSEGLCHQRLGRKVYSIYYKGMSLASQASKETVAYQAATMQSPLQITADHASLTMRSTSSSSGTGSRSGTVNDSGNCAPLVRASAALMVVEKHSNQAHSFGFQDAGSGRQL